MDSLHIPFTCYGYVLYPGDIHVSSYLRWLSEKLETYADVQVFCLRETFTGRETLEDIVDGATLVVGVLPSNDLDVLRADIETVRTAMVAEGLSTSRKPQFVCGIDCLCYVDGYISDDSESDSDEDSGDYYDSDESRN